MKTTLTANHREQEGKIVLAGTSVVRRIGNMFIKPLLASALLAAGILCCESFDPLTSFTEESTTKNVDPLVGKWVVEKIDWYEDGYRDEGLSESLTNFLNGVSLTYSFKADNSYEITYDVHEDPQYNSREAGTWETGSDIIYLTKFESDLSGFPSSYHFMIMDNSLRLKVPLPNYDECYSYYYCRKQ